MSSKSAIEWTGHTWNPVVGCSIISPGCTNCYAMKMAARIEAMGNQPRYAGTTRKVNGKAVWTGKLAQAPDSTLLEPLKRKKPTVYFVNSMSDLFHESVPDEWIDKVFAVMALCPQHTFQVLTKRAKRMREYFLNPVERIQMIDCMRADRIGDRIMMDHVLPDYFKRVTWPLPNVWLGVSTERQQEYDDRWPDLASTPAAVRFISYEPALGPLNIQSMALVLDRPTRMFPDWVICGGESGPAARPMHPDWARSLRDQCSAAGVPFFFKQWGNWHPEIDRDKDDPDWRQPYADYKEPHFQILNLAGGRGFHGERVHVMRLCSKKSAGRHLDGKLHDDMPQRADGKGRG